jgi:hypothetical protein
MQPLTGLRKVSTLPQVNVSSPRIKTVGFAPLISASVSRLTLRAAGRDSEPMTLLLKATCYAAGVVANLSTMVDKPTTERQALRQDGDFHTGSGMGRWEWPPIQPRGCNARETAFPGDNLSAAGHNTGRAPTWPDFSPGEPPQKTPKPFLLRNQMHKPIDSRHAPA